MMNYVAQEYLLIEKTLEPFVFEHSLDVVTVNSLVRGCVEIIEPELPSASLTILNEHDLDASSSIRLRNIKVNFAFALKTIFDIKTLCTQKDIFLLLYILKMIVSFIVDIKVDFEREEALVLYCVYRLRSATVDSIINYYKNAEFEVSVAEIILDEQVVNKAIEKLQKVGTIDIDEGEYRIVDIIIVK